MLRLGLAIAGLVIVADQACKYLMYDLLIADGLRMVEVLPFFNLVPVWNFGVSFGMFNFGPGESRWVLIALALAIVTALVVWLRRADQRLVAVALGLVIGGALGNVVDRSLWGAVFDFLDFHVGGWHWPAFNIADSGISIGVALLLFDALLGSRASTKPSS